MYKPHSDGAVKKTYSTHVGKWCSLFLFGEFSVLLNHAGSCGFLHTHFDKMTGLQTNKLYGLFVVVYHQYNYINQT